MEWLDTTWDSIRDTQTVPEGWAAVAAVLVALVLVGPRPAWRISRNLVTIAHEGGHALVALLMGRRLSGIKLHSDTSGVTVSSGRPTGFGMILTAFAGYPAPSLLGLGAAFGLASGYVTVTLWIAMALLVGMFVMIRNVYGAFTVLVAGGLVFAVSWWSADAVQAHAVSLIAWFLVLGGLRPIWELQAKRRTGRARTSDADQLARLTGLPGIVWVLAFGVVALACLAATVQLLIARL